VVLRPGSAAPHDEPSIAHLPGSAVPNGGPPEGRSSVVARDPSFAWVLLCFVLSGFVALLYQTAWTREFAFVFGTSELAVATVLAAYMGGLSAGAVLGGRLAPRIQRPVLAYAVLELGIGGAALAVPAAIAGCTRVAVALFGGAPEPPDATGLALPLFYLAASFAILLVPTALMGATLPLLARHVVRTEHELGSRVAWLYGLNTGGAVLGTLCAAFVLLPALGLRSTVAVGAGLNVVVFFLAAWVARRSPAPQAASDPREREDRVAPAGSWRIWRDPERILPLMLLSGAASFAYEVLWTRLLTHVLGGSVYAFATMLASFLAGIALGSAAASRWAHSRENAVHAFSVIQVGIALASLVAYASLNQLPAAARALGAHAGGSLAGSALLASALLLPSTLFIGATFPLAVRILARGPRAAGPASARVLAWNTVGSILGAVGAGFALIPGLGFGGTLSVCLAIGLGIAAVTALGLAPTRRRFALAPAALLAVLVVVRPGPPDLLLRTSPLAPKPLAGRMTYMATGRSATVSLVDVGGGWHLRTNGLPEAYILPPGREPLGRSAAAWLGVLPSLVRPTARDLLVVGFGGGVLLERVPAGIERIDAIELEPEVIEANRAVADRRGRDPLRDPRLRIHLNDARGALLLTDRRWDALVSQPSHPWTAGASHLYTREFFALVRDHLRPGGVFVQWVGLPFIDEPLARSLVATLRAVFPEVQVYAVRSALFLVASREPLAPAEGLREARRIDAEPFDELGLLGPEELAAHLVLDGEGARRFAGDAPVSTDDRNLLQMRARDALRDPLTSDGLRALIAPIDPLSPPDPAWGLDPVRLVRRLLETGQVERAERVARSLPAALDRRLARALVELPRDPVAARRALEALVADAPERTEARKALLVASLEGRASREQVRTVAASLGETGSAFAEAWRLERTRRWGGLRALEPALARIDARDALFPLAARMRIRWRVHVGAPEQATEAVSLADRALSRLRNDELRILRARALARSGAVETALGDLEDLAQALVAPRAQRGPRTAGTVQAARRSRATLGRKILRVLEELPRDPALAPRRARLERMARWAAARSRGSGA